MQNRTMVGATARGYEKHRGYGRGGGGAYHIHKVEVELLLFPSSDDFKQDFEEEYELEVVEESDGFAYRLSPLTPISLLRLNVGSMVITPTSRQSCSSRTRPGAGITGTAHGYGAEEVNRNQIPLDGGGGDAFGFISPSYPIRSRLLPRQSQPSAATTIPGFDEQYQIPTTATPVGPVG